MNQLLEAFARVLAGADAGCLLGLSLLLPSADEGQKAVAELSCVSAIFMTYFEFVFREFKKALRNMHDKVVSLDVADKCL